MPPQKRTSLVRPGEWQETRAGSKISMQHPAVEAFPPYIPLCAFAMSVIIWVPESLSIGSMASSISPKEFGATGDGKTNDIGPVRQAFQAAITENKPVHGGDGHYAVDGEIWIPRALRPWVADLRLRQLYTTLDHEAETLVFEQCEGIKIEHLEVDRGDNPKNGSLNGASGVAIRYGTGHEIDSIKVFGHGMGMGIFVIAAKDSQFNGLNVCDMLYSDPSATDDRMQGIAFINTEDCTINDPVVRNLSGDSADYPRFQHKWTRGMAFGGNRNLKINQPRVRDVDQGIDITGSQGNIGVEVLEGLVEDCDTWAYKVANSAVRCALRKCVGRNAGMAPFTVSGPSEPEQPYKTDDVLFEDCDGYNAGYNNIGIGTTAGFRIMEARYFKDYPRNVRHVRCRAIDEQPRNTMMFGFHSEIEEPSVHHRAIYSPPLAELFHQHHRHRQSVEVAVVWVLSSERPSSVGYSKLFRNFHPTISYVPAHAMVFLGPRIERSRVPVAKPPYYLNNGQRRQLHLSDFNGVGGLVFGPGGLVQLAYTPTPGEPATSPGSIIEVDNIHYKVTSRQPSDYVRGMVILTLSEEQ